MDLLSSSNFEEQYETFTKKNSWNNVFQLLNKASYERSLSLNKITEAEKIHNFKLNRYSNVLPFDETRIKLNNLDNDYINASLVQVKKAERNYILTQGPLINTVSHFWLMVWQNDSRAIVMLNKLKENGIDKCYLYWPTEKNKLKLKDVDLEVELISEKEDSDSDFVIREFTLINTKEEIDRSIFHFHYLSWPDFNVPKSSVFVKFLYTVRQSGLLDSNKYGPSIIHCSAGIGRSGTCILVDSYLVLLKKSLKQNKPEKLDGFLELLLEMRNYRLGLVQTPNQLKFAYEAIIYAKNSKFFKQEEELEQENIQSNLLTENLSNNSPKELRKRIREERKQKTINHLKRIKDKQKELEDDNNKKKSIKFIALIIATFIVGAVLYKVFKK